MDFKIDKKKKALVTGGTGFVAGWIIKQLVEAGVHVHATVRNPSDENKVGHLLSYRRKALVKLHCSRQIYWNLEVSILP